MCTGSPCLKQFLPINWEFGLEVLNGRMHRRFRDEKLSHRDKSIREIPSKLSNPNNRFYFYKFGYETYSP